MAGLIPQSFIDDLLNRSDIVEVVSSRIQLKKAGKKSALFLIANGQGDVRFIALPLE